MRPAAASLKIKMVFPRFQDAEENKRGIGGSDRRTYEYAA
jgi:hypothetical protein